MPITLRPLIVLQGTRPALTLTGLQPDSPYHLVLLPVRDPNARVELHAASDDQGRLMLEPALPWAGEILCDILVEGSQALLETCHFYALPPELAHRRPLRVDFHMHTTFSDGKNSPAEMVLRGRELGLDALAITDHNYFDSSLTGIAVAKKAQLGLLCFSGEEVTAGTWHVVSIGASGGVGFEPEREGYAGMLQSIDLIHALGGRAYLAHPYWIYRRRTNMPWQDYARLLQQGGFDGVELLGDCTWEENLRAVAQFGAQALFGRYPVLGNSDAHSSAHTLGAYWSLVMAEDLTHAAVLKAIEERYSVACGAMQMAYGNYSPRPELAAFGALDLVDLSLFLHHYYFPRHDELCRQEADAGRRILAGESGLLDLVSGIKTEMESYYRDCFGLD